MSININTRMGVRIDGAIMVGPNFGVQLSGPGDSPWPLLDVFYIANPPLLHYKLEEATGAFVNTGTATGFNGAASGTMDRAQPSGTLGAQLGIEADGATSFILVTDGPAIDGIAELTVLAVIRPDSAGEGSQGLVISKINEWLITMVGSARVDFLRNYGTTNAEALTNVNALVYGNTYAIAARIASDKIAHIFINGVEASYGTHTTGVGTVTTTAQNLHLASANGAIAFDGGIFDIAVYASALTDQQIEDHYNAVFF